MFACMLMVILKRKLLPTAGDVKHGFVKLANQITLNVRLQVLIKH